MIDLPTVNKPKRIQALQRAMAILEAIGASADGMRLQDLAEHVGLTPGAVHHIVDTLAADGYVVRGTQPVVYRLGPALMALAGRGQHSRLRTRIDQELLALAARLPGVNVVYCEAVGLEFRMLRQVTLERRDRIEPLPESITPPYASAASVVHFAYWPLERVEDFAAQRPFEAHGSAMWQSRAHFDDAVALVREIGYVDLPLKDAHSLRIGVPVLRADGALVGSFTLTARSAGNLETLRSTIIHEARQATRRIREAQENTHA
jgi:DNA-binding IclR family transcriptional regulator